MGERESTSHPARRQISSLVLDSNYYLGVPSGVSSNLTPSSTKPEPPSAVRNGDASPLEGERQSPKTSFAGLDLGSVNYDTILASSAKGLRVTLDPNILLPPSPSPPPPSPLFSGDVRTPPNTPARLDLEAVTYGSLMGASTTIMETSSDIGKPAGIRV